MLRIFPEESDGSSEYGAAEALSAMISEAWPFVRRQDARVDILVGRQCYGQPVEDVDLILLIELPHALMIEDGSQRAVRRLCATIEVKDHSRAQVSGGDVIVEYSRNTTHNASEQSRKQRYSLLEYIKRHNNGVAPYVSSLLWMRGLSRSELDRRIENIVCGDEGWDVFISRLLNASKTRDSRTMDAGDLGSVREIMSGSIEASPLDRKRIDRIAQAKTKRLEEFDALGKELIILRGRGGTGKTFQLLSLAVESSTERGDRVMILTYNRALVADLHRLIALTGNRLLDDSGVAVRTVQSFVRGLLRASGLASEEELGRRFIDEYATYAQSLRDLLQDVSIRDELLATHDPNGHDYRWDYVFVDEGQDWPDTERDILMALYGRERLVIADGIDQMVRGQIGTNWRTGPMDVRRELKSCLRMKTGLVKFAQGFAEAADLGGYKLRPTRSMVGGRVHILVGELDDCWPELAMLLGEACSGGNEPVDQLLCIPGGWASQNSAGQAKRLVGHLGDAGFNVWDAVRSNLRSTYPESLDQLRLLQYNSCRGLEGWAVFCLGLDDFFDQEKSRALTEGTGERNLLTYEPEKVADAQAYRWLMIPFTRPIDSLVIHLSDSNHRLVPLLQAAARSAGDLVTWTDLSSVSRDVAASLPDDVPF